MWCADSIHVTLIAIIPSKPELINNEAVPFRYTPNFQRFITPIGTEGLLTSSMLAIARCLTESEVSRSPATEGVNFAHMFPGSVVVRSRASTLYLHP